MSAIQEHQPGASWMAIIKRRGTPEFADAFTPDVCLGGSVLHEELRGVDAVAAVFGATSTMYESIAFTHEAVDGSHTFLTWEGVTSGAAVSGATILSHNVEGRIYQVQLFHRPLPVIQSFAEELQRKLAVVRTS